MTKKVPCALLLNDIHVSKDNIPEFQKNWDEALSLCIDRDIPDIVIGGDLFLSRSSQTLNTLMAVRQSIIKATKENINITIAEGNHDKVDQESILGYAHIFSEYPNVDVVDECSVIDLNDKVTLFTMSYFPENGSFCERLQNIIATDLEKGRVNVLYIHEGINGALATPNEKELPTNIFEPFDNVLVGHYHNRCAISGTNIEYIGSSRQHNFGEDEEKGYTILYSDGSYEFVKNQVNTRYKVINLTSDFDESLNDIENMSKSGLYKIKARVACSSQDAATIDKQKLIDAGVTKVEIVTDEVTITSASDASLDKKYDKTGIKGEYVNFCADKGISNVEMGLQYLDKIN
jgi:exonuclease SbcD